LASDDDDRPDHFEGEPSRTLEEALQNFSEANARLAEIVGQDSPDTQAVFEVHQLTYTLENAVDKIRDEMEDLAEVLEEVHKASERNDGETVTARGRVYLEKARKIAP
jgi:phage terminase small subunit